MKVSDALKRPSLAHPFGTDRFGRDVLSRTIYGSRIALGVALSSIGLALVVGTILGLAGGYVGGATDLVIGRAMDVLFSFPTLILAIGIAAMLGPGLDNAALAIAVVYAPLFSRVVRGPVIAERAKEYAVAALGLGAGSFRVGPPPHPAQRAGAADRADVGAPRLRDPHRGGAQLSRPGHAAAGAVVGTMLNEGRDLSRDRAVDERLPGPGDHARRARLQPARRRVAHRVRPASSGAAGAAESGAAVERAGT